MDFDAHERHIRNLLTFKTRMEEMLDGAGPGPAGPNQAELLEDLRKDVTELGEAITGLQQFKDEIGGFIAGVRDAAPLFQWLADNKDGLQVLLSLGETVDGQPAEPVEPEEPASEGQADQLAGQQETAAAASPFVPTSEAPAPEAPASNEPAASSEAPAEGAPSEPSEPTPAPGAP